MQDSIEDYIRISRNTSTNTKNEELISAQFKKECETKAMQIIQFSIEGKLRSDALFKCLPFINECHYQDIVEERAITKLCGYPLCSKKIPEMPKKQYHISVKCNQVYDISERKNFCSNYCYKASIHIKNQIDTSPLWLRNHSVSRIFTILSKLEKGLPGELIDHGIAKIVVEPLFTSISGFAKLSLDEAEENEVNSQEDPKPKNNLRKHKKIPKNAMNTITEIENEEDDLLEFKKTEKPQELQIKPAAADTTPKPNVINIEELIAKSFREWISLDTYIYIFGEQEIKRILNNEKVCEYFESQKTAEFQMDQHKKYIEICKKLQMKELADTRLDNALLQKGYSPIPNYQQLKEEGKQIKLQVQSFYSGEITARDTPSLPVTEKSSEENAEEVGVPSVLPLNDNSSQTLLRRRIFANALNISMQGVLQKLRISPSTVLPNLQAFVKTLNLKAHNITFKPMVWNYIAILFLKILSLRDEGLNSILIEDSSKEILDVYYIRSLPNKWKTIEELLGLVNNIEWFFKDCFTSQ